jgi:hypothetical protein
MIGASDGVPIGKGNSMIGRIQDRKIFPERIEWLLDAFNLRAVGVK